MPHFCRGSCCSPLMCLCRSLVRIGLWDCRCCVTMSLGVPFRSLCSCWNFPGFRCGWWSIVVLRCSPITAYLIKECLYQVREVFSRSKFRFMVWRGGRSVNPDWRDCPSTQLLREESLVWRQIPFDIGSPEPPKNASSRPNLLEAGNLFLPFFLVPFMSV